MGMVGANADTIDGREDPLMRFGIRRAGYQRKPDMHSGAATARRRLHLTGWLPCINSVNSHRRHRRIAYQPWKGFREGSRVTRPVAVASC